MANETQEERDQESHDGSCEIRTERLKIAVEMNQAMANGNTEEREQETL